VKVLDGAARSTAFAVSPGNVCIMHVIEGADHVQRHTVVADEPFELSGIRRVAIATISERARP
jgi:hypothetical protein